jgi:hypothetical protein
MSRQQGRGAEVQPLGKRCGGREEKHNVWNKDGIGKIQYEGKAVSCGPGATRVSYVIMGRTSEDSR